jgi:hypothetical protein
MGEVLNTNLFGFGLGFNATGAGLNSLAVKN